MKFERISDITCEVGESPVWHAGEQALYWTDIPARKLWRWHAGSQQTASWTLPEMAGCIAMTATGGWLLAMETGIFTTPKLTAEQAAPHLTRVATVSHMTANMRFNDGRTDRQGRFWAGTMVQDASLKSRAGKVYRYDGNGLSAAVVEDLLVPNGMAFSPDGRTIYLSDSHPSSQGIWTFDYDIDDGVPHNRRTFVDMKEYPGRPDGAAVDVDGCYWICGNDEGVIHRFTPEGKLDRSLAVPMLKPAMCAFGGARMDTLFVTSIRPGSLAANEQPDAGAIYALQIGIQGINETPVAARR